MDKTISITKAVIAAMGAWIIARLGGADHLITLLLILTGSDMVFGGAKGIKNKNFSSSIFFWGLINKAIIFVVIAIMVQVDLVIGKSGFLRNAFIIWFCICESASILENTATLGLPWPDGLVNILVQVRKGFSINLSKIVQKIIDEYKVIDLKEEKTDE